MFKKGVIVAYPTDTSFGLGVRVDDAPMLEQLYALKQRPTNKYCSVMVRDWAMLQRFAEVPAVLDESFFVVQPRTVILKPTSEMPRSEFWPEHAVGFRIATRPAVAAAIDFPITATSANLSGQPSIYDPVQIKEQWGSAVELFSDAPRLDDRVAASEIWDYTNPDQPEQLR